MFRRLSPSLAAAALLALVPALALAAASPTISHESAAKVSSSSAVLHATVNPNGSSTVTYFEIGLTTSYGTDTTQLATGSGSKPVDESTRVTGLLPGTVYHFRAVAQNHAGQTIGADHTFRTSGNPPAEAATGAANSESKNGATVTGVINPENQATSYEFQYGLTTAYGSSTLEATVPKGKAPVSVSAVLTGLQPGAEFHYRLVAFHGSLPSYGDDVTFFTEPTQRPEPSLSAKTSPKRAKRSPYRLSTSGTLGRLSIFPAADACTGTVKVRMFNGSRRVALSFAALASNCTYTDTIVLRHLPKHPAGAQTVRLKVLTYFNGNGYIGPRKAHVQYVTIGR